MTSELPIASDAAPPSTGTCTQAIRSGDLVFVTGQTVCDPVSGNLAEGLEAQARLTMVNIDSILGEARCTKADIVDVKFILADIKLFKLADKIYAEWLPPRDDGPLPTCTAFVAGALPGGALLELAVTAALPGDAGED